MLNNIKNITEKNVPNHKNENLRMKKYNTQNKNYIYIQK